MFNGTERQHSYIVSLMEERQHESGVTVKAHYEATVPGGMAAVLAQVDSTKTASSLIDELMRLPRAPRQAAPRPATDLPVTDGSPRPQRVLADPPPVGIHFHEGTVYKVQESMVGRLYAKRLATDPIGWSYAASGPLADLSEATLMTREQAAEFGHQFGVCAICGKLLTDPASIERGIGPVCAKRVS